MGFPTRIHQLKQYLGEFRTYNTPMALRKRIKRVKEEKLIHLSQASFFVSLLRTEEAWQISCSSIREAKESDKILAILYCSTFTA